MWLDRHLASFLDITVICRPFCAWSVSRSDLSLPMKKRFHGPSMEGNSGEDMQRDEIKHLHRRLLPPNHKLFVLYQTTPNPCMEFKKKLNGCIIWEAHKPDNINWEQSLLSRDNTLLDLHYYSYHIKANW